MWLNDISERVNNLIYVGLESLPSSQAKGPSAFLDIFMVFYLGFKVCAFVGMQKVWIYCMLPHGQHSSCFLFLITSLLQILSGCRMEYQEGSDTLPRNPCIFFSLQQQQDLTHFHFATAAWTVPLVQDVFLYFPTPWNMLQNIISKSLLHHIFPCLSKTCH